MSFEDAKKDLAEGIVNLILEKSNTIRYLIDNQENIGRPINENSTTITLL